MSTASSIFLMISQLYTLLAHLRSLGRDGTSCSTSSYLTATSRQHIATSWREVFGTLTLLSTRSMYCTARSAVVGPNPKSAHTSSIHSMSVVRYFMCAAVLGSSLHRCLVRSRSRRVSSTSHQTLPGVAEAGLQSPNRSQSSVRVVPRKGDRSAGRRSAASLAACASLSSRCLAPKPVASGNVSLSLMKRSSSLSASVSSQSAEPAGSGRTSYPDPQSIAVAVLAAGRE
mmetsp:Transcript_5943/g.24543  ORF Transcript_5943/g.24543 Transcript_5943/m.24543 type:complete len:229 (-) Transcript_5943:562-1248(-)